MSFRRGFWKLCLFVPLATFAEDADGPPAGEPVVVLEEIVVKSGRAPQVDTLEVREVRETSARDLGEALAASPNLGKVRKAGIANDIVLRGLQRDDVALAIDGAQVHGACPSRMDPPAFHLDYAEVDRVEVKKGPFDVTTPGGLGGVVDVHARRAHPGWGTEVNLGGASESAVDASGTASYGSTRYDVLVGGAWKKGAPFVSGDGRSFTAVPVDGARFRDQSGDQTAYDVRSGFARAGLALAPGQRLEVAYTRQSAADVLYPYLRMDGLRDDTDRATATYTAGALGPFSRLLARVYASRVEHDMTDEGRCSSSALVAGCSGALPRDYAMRTLASSSTWGGKLEAGLGGFLDLLFGADFYARRWDNVTTRLASRAPGSGLPYVDERSIPDVSILDGGLYAEARRDLSGVRASAGVRLDVARTEAAVDRSDLYRVFHPAGELASTRDDVLLAGNLQAEYDVAGAVTLFAGYGHGTRVPDPQERYFALSGMGGNADWLGFPGLAPPRSDEVDLGVRLAGQRVLLKAQVFHAWLGDHVALVSREVAAGAATRRAKTYANVDARTFGYEASGRMALPAQLFLGASAAFTRGENDTDGVPLAEIAPFQAAASLRWDDGVFFVEAEEAFAARQDRVDARVLETPTPSHWTTSLRAGAAWRGGKLFAGVRNVFDRHYVEHLAYLRDPFASGAKVPEPGRTLYVNAQYAF